MLRQPVENVRAMPANGLATVCSLRWKSPEHRHADQYPARSTGKTGNLATTENRMYVWEGLVDPSGQMNFSRGG
jgi:hypothetical protein